MAIDVTVTSPFSVKRTVVVPLTAAKKMEVSKRKKYLEISRGAGLLFCPFAIEAYGELQLMLQQGMSWALLIKEIKGFGPINWAASSPKAYWYQRLYSHYGEIMQER